MLLLVGQLGIGNLIDIDFRLLGVSRRTPLVLHLVDGCCIGNPRGTGISRQ